ncbi:MAG: hypothetical protein JNJ54_23585 [Myxococcaceae bacterium]|nr:hypothetical protein [Myxococcaceae bacterium]
MKSAVLLGAVVTGCVTTDFVRQPDPKPCVDAPRATGAPAEQAIREALASFVAAVDAKDFGAALELLAGSWRKRYSAERLARDFAAEPRGVHLVDRLKSSLAAPFTISGERATLPLGAGRAARLVHESAGWRIASLDGDSSTP